MFYGNGTAANVKGTWRDRGYGVLSDLGCHLLDLALFLLGSQTITFQAWGLHRNETYAYDHVAFGSDGPPVLEIEATLLSWRNTFTIDVIGELGSAHVDGLRKWGPSTLTVRKRAFPSGRPNEQVEVSEGPDPTWEAEHRYFKQMCAIGGSTIEKDIWIAATIEAVANMAKSPAAGAVSHPGREFHGPRSGNQAARRAEAGTAVPEKKRGIGR
jgi:predicted dehydrogenase